MRSARRRPVRWLSGRALLLHLTLVLVVPLCVMAGWWQLQRALSGNTLSFVYVFEWPAFSAIAVWAWWVLLTAPTREGPSAAARPEGAGPATARPATARPLSTGARGRPSQLQLLADRTAPLRWDSRAEDDRLRAYNAYLAGLVSRPAKERLPRRPTGGGRA